MEIVVKELKCYFEMFLTSLFSNFSSRLAQLFHGVCGHLEFSAFWGDKNRNLVRDSVLFLWNVLF